ncbi:unnamed protein product [Rhizophagus irregularis]|nr:unnamed protein product [Rhizophagus irregularis]
MTQVWPDPFRTLTVTHYTILLDKDIHLYTCLLLINKELTDLYGPQSSQSFQLPIKSKAMYAELFGLLKKAIDYATKADMQHELLNVFKAFIYDVQSRLEVLTNINNSIIVKHKG